MKVSDPIETAMYLSLLMGYEYEARERGYKEKTQPSVLVSESIEYPREVHPELNNSENCFQIMKEIVHKAHQKREEHINEARRLKIYHFTPPTPPELHGWTENFNEVLPDLEPMVPLLKDAVKKELAAVPTLKDAVTALREIEIEEKRQNENGVDTHSLEEPISNVPIRPNYRTFRKREVEYHKKSTERVVSEPITPVGKRKRHDPNKPIPVW